MSTFLAKRGSVKDALCTSLSYSIVVPSLPAPPLTTSAQDSQTLCPEGGEEKRRRGRKQGRGEKEERVGMMGG